MYYREVPGWRGIRGGEKEREGVRYYVRTGEGIL
jgi:hypothetical protein